MAHSFFLYQDLISLVWSGRIPQAETIKNHDNAVKQQYTVTPALIAIVDKEEHARRRRPWIRGFTTSALKGYESLVIKRSLQLAEVLLSQNLEEAVDLAKWIELYRYAATILASCVKAN